MIIITFFSSNENEDIDYNNIPRLWNKRRWDYKMTNENTIDKLMARFLTITQC